jgi:hypothetical protein
MVVENHSGNRRINNLALKLPRELVSGFLGMLFSKGG